MKFKFPFKVYHYLKLKDKSYYYLGITLFYTKIFKDFFHQLSTEKPTLSYCQMTYNISLRKISSLKYPIIGAREIAQPEEEERGGGSEEEEKGKKNKREEKKIQVWCFVFVIHVQEWQSQAIF